MALDKGGSSRTELDGPMALCRDCGAKAAPAQSRCRKCRSPRILHHAELSQLSIAHLDCDAFYAAVEKRDNPELMDKPLIIGGGRRGVVATCCYIARTYGIHSAMPMFQANKLCPDAVVMPPNMQKYGEVGRDIRALMRDVTPLVQPLSIDEAFLDLTGTERLHHATPAETMVRLVLRIEDETGISTSVGLSYNKFLAKLASDLDKPRGFSVIGRAEVRKRLAPMPVSKIWGVGKALQNKLRKDGITTIGQLQNRNERALIKRYGVIGSRLAQFSLGRDERMVRPGGSAKSVSNETTLGVDIADQKELEAILWRLSDKVSSRLKASGIAGDTVVLKLKAANFRQKTRNRKLSGRTQLADQIFHHASELLAREIDGTAYRLIGIGISGLGSDADADQPDLIDGNGGKRETAERAMDKIRDKFGDAAIIKGRGLPH